MGSRVVDVVDRMVDVEIAVGVDDPSEYVVVRVLGPGGEPLPARGTSVSTAYDGPSSSSSGGGQALRRTDGSWLVRFHDGVPAPGTEPEGTWKIRVSHGKLGRLETVLDPPTRRELVLRFGAAARLVVEVAGIERAGLGAKARLYLKRHLETNGISFGTRPADRTAEGFVFEAVQPGDWFLVLVAGDFPRGILLVDRKRIALGEGESEVTWALPELHTVRIEVADPEKRLSFEVQRLDGHGEWTSRYVRRHEDGVAVLRHVAPGRYRLTGRYGHEERTLTLDVPARTRIRLE